MHGGDAFMARPARSGTPRAFDVRTTGSDRDELDTFRTREFPRCVSESSGWRSGLPRRPAVATAAAARATRATRVTRATTAIRVTRAIRAATAAAGMAAARPAAADSRY